MAEDRSSTAASTQPEVRRPVSLHRRLLLAGSIGLAAFLSLTGVALDAAFRDSARAAVRDRLQGQVYALLAAAELRGGGDLAIPEGLPEARLSRPGSGLYAAVFGNDYEWRSDSALGLALPWLKELTPGETRFTQPLDSEAGPVFRLAQGVAWESGPEEMHRFTFNVLEDTTIFREQVNRFRRTLWVWLGAAAVVLMALQLALLRWTLRPVRAISTELHEVERGRQDAIHGDYPEELRGFREHLNAFISAEREHLKRYRNTLSDLAHNLKTPLAVLKAGLEDPGPDRESLPKLRQQVDRMDELVAYRLKRAARAGGRTLGAGTPMKPIAEQIVEALDKVYAGRGVQCDVALNEGAVFPGEEGDLYELLGNLLDNAYKWGESRVRLQVRVLPGGRRPGLEIVVEDDGPGIEPERLDELLQRGKRGDERVPGHGLGLAMVNEIVQAWGGSLTVDRGDLRGARVIVFLPGR